MANLTIGQLKALAFTAGFNSDQVPTAAAIAMAESSGNPAATNTNTNGSTDRGLWQINSVHADILKMGNVLDPATNAAMAFKVYKLQGWTAWVAYTNGSYRKFMDTKTPYVTLPGLKVQDVPGTSSTLPELAAGGASKVADIPGSIKAAADAATAQLGKMAGMGAAVAVAVVLLALGVVILLGKPALAVAAVTTPAGKVAKLASTAAGTGGAHRA